MLSDHHREMLKASAISDAVIDARGYFTVHNDMSWPGQHELASFQQRYPGLAIPIYRMGEDYTMVLRPDNPRSVGRANGEMRSIKYEWPAETKLVLDVPSYTMRDIGDKRCPLFLTEGAKKADSIYSHFADVAVANVNGVWGWQRKDADGNHQLLEDFHHIPLRGRIVVLAFDSDARTNVHVRGALNALRLALLRRGAIVGVMDLSGLLNKPESSKLGIDDALAANVSVQKLGSLISYSRIDNQDRRFWDYIRRTDPFIS